jgi:hypothetical protein
VRGKQFIEVIEVVVAEHMNRAARRARAVDDAGVVELVAEYRRRICRGVRRIASADSWPQPRQRRQHRGIGLEAAGEQQRRLAALEGGEAFLHRQRDPARAGHQARGRRAGAVALRPFGGARLEQRMLAEAEVIVGRHIEQRPACASRNCRSREGQARRRRWRAPASSAASSARSSGSSDLSTTASPPARRARGAPRR